MLCVEYFQDPFAMSVHKAVWGTKDKPTVVPSMYEERLVGCICKSTVYVLCWALIGTRLHMQYHSGNSVQNLAPKLHIIPHTEKSNKVFVCIVVIAAEHWI